jgi:hypothetical protein
LYDLSQHHWLRSVSPTSVDVNGTAVVTLTVTAASATASIGPDSAVLSGPKLWMLSGSGAMLTCFFLGGISRKRRNPLALVILAVFALIVVWTACGGGGSQNVQPPPPPPPPNLTTYSVVVSATANGIIHSAKVTVVVQ